MSDHVLIASGANTRDGDRIYHQPDSDNPDAPACRNNRVNTNSWVRKDPETIPHHRECKDCAGDSINRSHTGAQVCTQIQGLWSDDSEGSA